MNWFKRMIALLMAGSLVLSILGTKTSAAGSYTAVAEPSQQYQTIEGWGTSLAWWGKVVGSYSNRDEYAEKMFSPTNGLGLNVIRYNIGGGKTRHPNTWSTERPFRAISLRKGSMTGMQMPIKDTCFRQPNPTGSTSSKRLRTRLPIG